MLEIKHYKDRTSVDVEEESVSLMAWNVGGRRFPSWSIYDLNKRDASGSNYFSVGSATSRQEALTQMCWMATAPLGSDVITYTKCPECKSSGSRHHTLCTRFSEGEREPRRERAPRPKKKEQEAAEPVAEPVSKVQLRTNIKGSEDRNHALSDDEIQVECQRGAISVILNTPPKHGARETVTVCTVRGIASRQAQVAEMDLDELDAFIALLEDARKGLKKAMNLSEEKRFVVGKTYHIAYVGPFDYTCYNGPAVYVGPYGPHEEGSDELPWYKFQLPDQTGTCNFDATCIFEQNGA